jgi:hypothetical protein
MFGINSFAFWRWRDEGPDFSEQIANLHTKLQDREATIAGLEELLGIQTISIIIMIMVIMIIIIYLQCELEGEKRDKKELEATLRGIVSDLEEEKRDKKELEATLRGTVSDFEGQSSAMELELTTLRKYICSLVDKLIESECKTVRLEDTLEGRIKEIRVKFNKLSVEASETKSNWDRIEGALRSKINYMKERISDIDRNDLEGGLLSQIKKRKATPRKTDAAKDWTPLEGIVDTFEGKEGNRENVEISQRREISEVKENLEEMERLLDEIRKNPVGTFSVPLSMATRTPTVLVEVDGIDRQFIIDTGATASLIQPGISQGKITATNIAIIGIADYISPPQGKQFVDFTLGGKVFHHPFYVGALGTGDVGILGTDFLVSHEARVDLANLKLGLRQSPRTDRCYTKR